MDTSGDSSVEAIKGRLREGLDGRPVTWLAEKTGDAYKNVQRWIGGDVEPPLDFIPRYCKATETSITWVMTGDGPKRPLPASEAERRLEQIRSLLEMPREMFRPMQRPKGDDGDVLDSSK